MPILSHSQLETWRTCPRRWAFHHLERVPEAPQAPLVLGRAVHAALEADNLARLAGHSPLDLPALQGAARTALQAEAEGALDDQFADLASRADALLDAYADHVQPRFQPLAAEAAFRFEVEDAPGWDFTGRIDALMEDDTGQQVIVDYKTATRVWKPGREHSTAQATAYVWAMQEQGQDVSQVVFVPLHTVTWAGRVTGYAELRPTARTPDDVQTYRAQVAVVIAEIEQASATGDYPAKPGWQCPWCPYQAICPAYTGAAPAARATEDSPYGNAADADHGRQPGAL